MHNAYRTAASLVCDLEDKYLLYVCGCQSVCVLLRLIVSILRSGVKILHLIPSPFPSVWHEDSDSGWAVDFPTVMRINRILRVFVFEYLGVTVYL